MSEHRADTPAPRDDASPLHALVRREPVRVAATEAVADAARRMTEAGQSAVVVDFVADGPGIVTEGDVVGVLADPDGDPSLAEIATHPLVTVSADDSLPTARERMRAEGTRHLGVTAADGRLLGLLDAGELLAASEAELADTDARLRATEEARYAKEQEAQGLFEEMFRKNPAPKLLIDPDTGTIADANPAALAFYGYSQAEIRRQRIQDINLLSEAEVQAEWEKARNEQRRYFSFRHRLANGEIRDVKVYSGPVAIAGKEYLHSIVHDVTEARRYQTYLERYKAIFDTLPVGVYRNRPGAEGPFEEVNPAMVRIFGAESAEALQRHPTAELYRDSAERQRFSEDLLAHGEIHRREMALRTLDDRPIWAAISARVRYDADGEPVFDGVVEDVTERHQMEQERAQLIEILEATPDYIGMAAPDGQILYANPALQKVIGSTEGSFQDKHPDWALEYLQEAALPTAERGGTWQGETALFDADGTPIPVSQTLVAHRDADGTVRRYSTIMRDISERRAMEAELERSNAELEAFAYAVSHDLQEPLRIINSYLGLLQRRYSDALDERAGRYIHATTDAAGRMRRMIQDLLEYSRVKRMGEEFRPVALAEVLEEARANLAEAIAASGAVIEAEELPTVQGDRGQLARLLQNLLSNAIKYGPDHEAPAITLTSRAVDGTHEIAVADNGMGFDPKHAERIFGVFQRLHTREEHEGTGAGLALAQRIVERHAGRIWAESEGEGCGATFRFTLPAAEGGGK